MDEQTQRAVTRALDIAIATVADEWFKKLSSSLSDQEIAEKVSSAFRSLRRLERPDELGRTLPDYDDWDALFYSVWYQPSQINLACTLALAIPDSVNPIKTGLGPLEVFDFGRGALAMNFGLSLASSNSCRKTPSRIFINGLDPSESMQKIGWEIWDCFVEEMCDVNNYRELRSLRRACFNMKFERQCNVTAKRWLTAFHVVYPENASEVKQNLEVIVKDKNPDAVLVTSHPSDERHAFSPLKLGYKKISSSFLDRQFTIKPDHVFQEIKKFRLNVRDRISPYERILPSFILPYLNNQPKWVMPYEPVRLVYVRQ